MFLEILFFRVLIPLIVIGILILVHEWGHFISAKRLGVVVEQFSIGFIGPKLFSFKRNSTEYIVTLIPWGGYVKLQGEMPSEGETPSTGDFYGASVGKRTVILTSGALMNILLAFLLFWGVSFWSGVPSSSTEIGGLKDGFPAQEIGLALGDRIIAINGREVDRWEEMAEIIHKSEGRSLELLIKRREITFTRLIKPRREEIPTATGQVKKISLIGITPAVKRYSLSGGIKGGIEQTWFWTKTTYVVLWKLIVGKVSVKNLGGPILIVQLAGEVAQSGLINLCLFIAIISVNLAIINLLPIPVADGGHILLCGIEKVRRRPLSLKTQELITRIGWVFILGLMLLVTFNDITRWFGR